MFEHSVFLGFLLWVKALAPVDVVHVFYVKTCPSEWSPSVWNQRSSDNHQDFDVFVTFIGWILKNWF